ncbi:MAG: GNAT family N-acetyltransferase [Gemmatimonadetes bacterium]|nr:GNAT family N-acetyltransferase [Gemmatimonadota bacterium]
MGAGLALIAEPGPERLREHSAATPENPFQTPEYAGAMQALGEQVLLLDASGAAGASTLAFLRRGWRGCFLRLDSVPPWPARSPVWRALLDGCTARAVTVLEIASYASIASDIPDLGADTVRRRRFEFPLAIDPNREPELSTQHRRNLARARKARLVVRHGADPGRARVHAALMAEALARHVGPDGAPPAIDSRVAEALLGSGAAEIHEAVRDDETFASVLVLRSARAGYYHSAGSSSAGRDCGAATLLVIEVARSLAECGAATFHLGGAGESEPGLRRFKEGFGATARPLEAVTAQLAPGAVRRLRGLWWRLLRNR